MLSDREVPRFNSHEIIESKFNIEMSICTNLKQQWLIRSSLFSCRTFIKAGLPKQVIIDPCSQSMEISEWWKASFVCLKRKDTSLTPPSNNVRKNRAMSTRPISIGEWKIHSMEVKKFFLRNRFGPSSKCREMLIIASSSKNSLTNASHQRWSHSYKNFVISFDKDFVFLFSSSHTSVLIAKRLFRS